MKKSIVLAAFIILLCGCGRQGTAEQSYAAEFINSSTEQNQSNIVSETNRSPNFFTGNINSVINNEAPYATLIAQTYHESTIIPDLLFFTRFSDATSNAFFYSNIIEKYNVDCVRNTESTRYIVFKTAENGLLYTFLNEDWGFPGNPSIRFSIYCKKELGKEEFQSVKQGTLIQEVGRIDPVIDVILKPIKQLDLKKASSFYTLHMLTDGVMMIFYNYSEEEQTWVVTDKIYSQENVLTVGEKIYDCTILPQDYIQ